MIRQLPVIFLILLFLNNDNKPVQEVINSRNTSNQDTYMSFPSLLKDDIGKIVDLRPGDILVKANHNWLPGTAQVYGGKGFGHAALVIKGAKDTNLLQLLRKTVIFESHSRDVAPEFQIRQAPAYLPGNDFRYPSITFGPQNFGYCFLLRPSLSPEEIQQLIGFVTGMDGGTSSWRAQKRFDAQNKKPAAGQEGNWYCSLLIWQAFYTLFGIDLDPTARIMVYPNDLIASEYIDNLPQMPGRRIRF
jgi:hypothetical protein